MKIVVLIKQVPDTWGERTLDLATGVVKRSTGEQVMDEIDERALEVALTYKDGADVDIVAMSMGPDGTQDSLRRALAMGADSAIHIVDDGLAGSDISTTAHVLAAALSKSGFDLVIAGNESTDGRGGVVPAMIAELLAIPHLTYLNVVEISAATVSGERSTNYATSQLRSSFPAVVSVTEQVPEARFPNFKGILRAKKKPLASWTKSELLPDSAPPSSFILQTTERPERAAGVRIVDTGDAGAQLADFLASGHFI